jgi:LPXTG-site transpeptidase (sortase) family protein
MAGVAALLAVATLGIAGCSGRPDALITPSAPANSRVAPATPRPVSGATSPGDALPARLAKSTPVRLQIAAIGVDTTLLDLGLRSDGTMEVPPGGFPAGWYTGGPTPGELGPAVIAGHVDMSGPGVFYRLHQMKPGDTIIVTRKDGTKPVFRVTRISLFPKDEFPTKLVYGNINKSVLRLITCGGTFNSRSGHYEDNIVAFADLAAPGR